MCLHDQQNYVHKRKRKGEEDFIAHMRPAGPERGRLYPGAMAMASAAGANS